MFSLLTALAAAQELCAPSNRCNKDSDCWIATQMCWFCDLNKTDPHYPPPHWPVGQCVHDDPCTTQGGFICGTTCCFGKQDNCVYAGTSIDDGARRCVQSPYKCTLSPTATNQQMQQALDWICANGGANCAQINSGGCCYQPNTLRYHTEWAIRQYYATHWQAGGNGTCYFGGIGVLVGF